MCVECCPLRAVTKSTTTELYLLATPSQLDSSPALQISAMATESTRTNGCCHMSMVELHSLVGKFGSIASGDTATER